MSDGLDLFRERIRREINMYFQPPQQPRVDARGLLQKLLNTAKHKAPSSDINWKRPKKGEEDWIDWVNLLLDNAESWGTEFLNESHIDIKGLRAEDISEDLAYKIHDALAKIAGAEPYKEFYERQAKQAWNRLTLRDRSVWEYLKIDPAKDPTTWSRDEIGRVIEALNRFPVTVKKAEAGREITAATEYLPKLRGKWFEEYGVPESSEERMGKMRTNVTAFNPYAGVYRRRTGKNPLQEPGKIELSIGGGIAPEILAHESAHAIYFEDMPRSLFPLYLRAHAFAMVHSPKYKEAVERYPIEGWRGLPTESYTTAYQYLGKHPEKIPWYLEPFYGKLMYPVPDLPGELEKTGLVWIASWLRDKFEKRIRKLLEENRLRVEQAAKRLLDVPREDRTYWPGYENKVAREEQIAQENMQASKTLAAWRKYFPFMAAIQQPPPMQKMGIPHYGEPGYPGSLIQHTPMKELELPELLEEVKTKLEKTPEEKRKEIRKKYPFIGWQK